MRTITIELPDSVNGEQLSHAEVQLAILGNLITLLNRMDRMDSRLKAIEDGITGEGTSVANLATVVPELTSLLQSTSAALAAAQTTLAGEPTDAEIAQVATDLGTHQATIDGLTAAITAALPAPAPAAPTS